MPIGIKPVNDFPFKKTFGTVDNKLALISLLNAILDLHPPIVDVTIENPYNLQDFLDDKLSILDVKAIDENQAIYAIEMQLTIFEGLVQRVVFYGCKLFPESAIQLATQTITRISKISEDKTMYDAREKAIRDQQWALNAAHREGVLEGEAKGKLEGKLEGEIKLIRTLEGILGLPLTAEADLQKQSFEELQKLTVVLQDKARNRV